MPIPKIIWADKSQSDVYDPDKLNALDMNQVKTSLNMLIDRANAADFVPASVALSGGGLLEKGLDFDIELQGSINPGSDTITARRLKRGATLLASPSGNAVSFTDPGITTGTTYTLEADTASNGTKSASTAAVFVAPSYYGAVSSTTPTQAQLKATAKQIWGPSARQLSFNCAGTYPAFVEPKANGQRGVIKDKNGFPITGDVAVSSLDMTLADGTTEACWLYVHKNPQTDPAFIFTL